MKTLHISVVNDSASYPERQRIARQYFGLRDAHLSALRPIVSAQAAVERAQFGLRYSLADIKAAVRLVAEHDTAQIETAKDGGELAFTRINNDVNGNPRYVVHFLNLNTDFELDARIGVLEKERIALARARYIGGRAYSNKRYGGGIVFQSYSLEEEMRHINRVTGRGFTAAVRDV